MSDEPGNELSALRDQVARNVGGLSDRLLELTERLDALSARPGPELPLPPSVKPAEFAALAETVKVIHGEGRAVADGLRKLRDTAFEKLQESRDKATSLVEEARLSARQAEARLDERLDAVETRRAPKPQLMPLWLTVAGLGLLGGGLAAIALLKAKSAGRDAERVEAQLAELAARPAPEIPVGVTAAQLLAVAKKIDDAEAARFASQGELKAGVEALRGRIDRVAGASLSAQDLAILKKFAAEPPKGLSDEQAKALAESKGLAEQFKQFKDERTKEVSALKDAAKVSQKAADDTKKALADLQSKAKSAVIPEPRDVLVLLSRTAAWDANAAMSALKELCGPAAPPHLRVGVALAEGGRVKARRKPADAFEAKAFAELDPALDGWDDEPDRAAPEAAKLLTIDEARPHRHLIVVAGAGASPPAGADNFRDFSRVDLVFVQTPKAKFDRLADWQRFARQKNGSVLVVSALDAAENGPSAALRRAFDLLLAEPTRPAAKKEGSP